MGDRALGAEDATFSAHSYHTCLLLPSLADACCVRYFDYFHGPSLLLHAIQGFLDCSVGCPIPSACCLLFGFNPHEKKNCCCWLLFNHRFTTMQMYSLTVLLLGRLGAYRSLHRKDRTVCAILCNRKLIFLNDFSMDLSSILGLQVHFLEIRFFGQLEGGHLEPY